MSARIWIYGDDVNTDVIFPGKYTYTVSDPAEMARHALEDLDPSFAKEVRSGDIIVAGKNFGCGSSREQAAFALKYAGVAVIIAKSFARIFYRNAINAGLPAIEHAGCVDAINPESEVEVDLRKAAINVDGTKFEFPPFPDQVMAILEVGDLVEYVRKTL
ncbi:MAG: 3-isopropylmalate dehydratase small subunit [Candidatus Coatesbacteria bacterium]|nr:3-isopropylmalate dehydratase small subunit [Candidatus Coatesbacteria bacterium]